MSFSTKDIIISCTATEWLKVHRHIEILTHLRTFIRSSYSNTDKSYCSLPSYNYKSEIMTKIDWETNKRGNVTINKDGINWKFPENLYFVLISRLSADKIRQWDKRTALLLNTDMHSKVYNWSFVWRFTELFSFECGVAQFGQRPYWKQFIYFELS